MARVGVECDDLKARVSFGDDVLQCVHDLAREPAYRLNDSTIVKRVVRLSHDPVDRRDDFLDVDVA